MTHLAYQDIGEVLNHYANVVEGNDTSTYPGVPGRYSRQEYLSTLGYLAFTASGSDDGTSESMVIYSSGTWPEDTFVAVDGAPFFLVNNTANMGRKIRAWDVSATQFTTDEFLWQGLGMADLVTADSEFVIMQGFKRIPANVDITLGESQFDRFFKISTDGPGERLAISGSGCASYKTEMRLDLRLTKPKNKRDNIEESMIANLTLLIEAISKNTQRNGLVRLCLPIAGSEELINDEYKLVTRIKFDLIYRIVNSFD